MISLLQAANFGALYANEVTLFNPLQPAEWELRGSDFDEPKFLRELSFGLSAILTLRPLIDKGICTFVDNRNYNFCHSCYSRGLRSAFGDEEVDIFFRLHKDFVENTTITYDGTFRGKGLSQ